MIISYNRGHGNRYRHPKIECRGHDNRFQHPNIDCRGHAGGGQRRGPSPLSPPSVAPKTHQDATKTLKSIAVATAIDFSTLKSIAVARAVAWNVLVASWCVLGATLGGDNGEGPRRCPPQAAASGGFFGGVGGLFGVLCSWRAS